MTLEEWTEKHTIIKDVPVQFFIRFTQKPKELLERAMLIAKDETGKEYTFTSSCSLDDRPNDLSVCEIEKEDD